MNNFFLKFLLIIGFIIGWILGTQELNNSKIRIKNKSLFDYLLDR